MYRKKLKFIMFPKKMKIKNMFPKKMKIKIMMFSKR